MTPDDLVPATSRARSPHLVRTLLVSACAIGLAGLALPGDGSPGPHLSVAPAASSTFLAEPSVPHGVARVSPRATRSRPLRVSRAVTRPQAAHVRVRWVSPSWAGVVSPFGLRWGRMHKGIDFGAPYGGPILAFGDGVVVGAGYLGEESGYGQITLIRHPDGMVSAYAHQSRIFVHEGQHVTAGDLIGLVGSTGESTGPHLHFEIRTSTHSGQIDPLPWLRSHGVSV